MCQCGKGWSERRGVRGVRVGLAVRHAYLIIACVLVNPSACRRFTLPLNDDTDQLTRTMEGWTKLQSGLANLNLGQSANRIAKGFNSSVQATRERLGQVAPDEITELPQGTETLLYLS